MKKLIAKASIQISKPVGVVFEAIVNPERMSGYFIAKSSGCLEAGRVVYWKFPEFDEEFPVEVKELIQDEMISLDWSGGVDGQVVKIYLSSYQDDSTVVKIEEFEMNDDEEGVKTLIRQTEGWANFLACLKAYLEYGINLRKGAFDFMFT